MVSTINFQHSTTFSKKVHLDDGRLEFSDVILLNPWRWIGTALTRNAIVRDGLRDAQTDFIPGAQLDVEGLAGAHQLRVLG